MSNFTDQLPRKATEKDLVANWGGGKPGEWFRCYLCGHKFKLGDTWRWVYAGGMGVSNFMVCSECDTGDVMDAWVRMNEEAKHKYWWFRR